MLVKHLIGCLGDLGSAGREVIEQFIVLGHLRDDEEDVLAGFLLHLEVEALTRD